MKRYNITVNGLAYDVTVEENNSNAPVQAAMPAPVSAPAPAPVASAPVSAPVTPVVSGGTPVKAPMPGTINAVKTSVGAEVKYGDVLLILEAMKMETDIVAPAGGKIASISVNKGDSVVTDQILVTIA
ncbi:MAG: acetyl-CoA carboxylase biotin carboxyl carrier protein subunit [Ruminococcus sp.]|jgi:biotin carboxyl carrier protein|nr:acetyl-CoA carboxylase biotin carboxyl carrier protein subunit [Ruminococcus sp.]